MVQQKPHLTSLGSEPIQLENDGGRQVVRLPPDVRVEGDLVYLFRDDATGDLVVSTDPPAPALTRHPGWDRLFELLDELGPLPEDFMAERPHNRLRTSRNVFDDDPE